MSSGRTNIRRLAVCAGLLVLAACARDDGGDGRRDEPSVPTALAGRTYALGGSASDLPPLAFAAPGASHEQQLYATFCASCHGHGGRGDGPASGFTRVPPADFSRAEFKLRSTPIGALPTDRDLEHVIRQGIGGDGAMPSFAFLGEADIRALVRVVKSFSMRWTRERPLAPVWDLAAYLRSLQRPPPEAAPTAVDTTTLDGYWQAPVPAQHGDLAAVSCASCHPLQFADWSRSRHAMAMGPGVYAKMQDKNPAMCASCHAPLENQATDTYLMADGVSCAACHMRRGQVFGPAATSDTVLPLVARHRPPHGQPGVRPFFEQSEFCSGCHHFAEGTAPVVHGTTLQNTFDEWRRSRAAREGRTCQTCHMPGRRHFFRGIHDPDTVRRAVRWTFDVNPRGAGVVARMTLTNIGAGHALPTYVVPEIWMQIEVKDRAGVTLATAERLIARRVRFDGGTWMQLSDTRLAPDETAALDYADRLPSGAVSIAGRVVVLPDAWQASSFSEQLATATSDKIRRYLHAALTEAQGSGYTLFQDERRLDR